MLEGESADSDDDGGSAGAMQVDEPDAGEGTVKGKGSWKSAENGQSQLNEFGIPRSTSASRPWQRSRTEPSSPCRR